jgi:hypothetical protein
MMQYYYGGHSVVRMDTPRGKAVLTFGDEEMALFSSRLPEPLHRKVVFGFAESWW